MTAPTDTPDLSAPNHIRTRREAAGLSGSELAKRAGLTLAQLAAVIGCEVPDFYFRDMPKP